jgi:hypothetical protein
MRAVFPVFPEPPAENVTLIQSGFSRAMLPAMAMACSTGRSPRGGKISNENVCLRAMISEMRMIGTFLRPFRSKKRLSFHFTSALVENYTR